MKSNPATLNHTISTKASLLEFERWFKKEFGKRPDSWLLASVSYDCDKNIALKTWLAREKIY